MKKLISVGLMIVGFLINRNANAQTGSLVFYEGNNATQKNIAVELDYPNYTTRIIPNDEARSLLLVGVRAGAVITLYDSKSWSTGDDYCVIRVKRLIGNRCVIGSFERSYEDDDVQVTYYRNNGLDGKVSSMKIN